MVITPKSNLVLASSYDFALLLRGGFEPNWVCVPAAAPVLTTTTLPLVRTHTQLAPHHDDCWGKNPPNLLFLSPASEKGNLKNMFHESWSKGK
nr:hypothetical protein [Candidatus Njordarchaeum guaymaensis]